MAIDTSKMYSRTQGFKIASACPIEHRFVLTAAQMAEYEADATFMPEAYFCICSDDNTFYTFKKNKPNDTGKITGKFTSVISAGSLTEALQYRGSINGTNNDEILSSIIRDEKSLRNIKVGYIYNLLDASTLTIDGVDTTYPAGTNIAVSNVDTEAMTVSFDPLGNSYTSEIGDINDAITAINLAIGDINSATYVNKLSVEDDIETSYTLNGLPISINDTIDVSKNTGNVVISSLKTLSVDKRANNYSDFDVLKCIFEGIVDANAGGGGVPDSLA